MMTGARGAGGGGVGVHNVRSGSPRRAALLLAAVAAALLLTGLGRAELFNPDEPREAELAREMLVSGDHVVPRLNGVPFLEKPPLFYWMVVPVLRLVGGPGEAAVRLVPALAGIASILVTFWFARHLLGDAVALLSGLVLLTAFEFFWVARRSMIDMPLTLAVLVACVALHRALSSEVRGRAGWLALASAACAAALLLKGIVGAGLPALALVAWLAARRDPRGLVRPGLVAAFALALAPIALWVMQLGARLGAAGVREFVLVNNVLRFTGGAARGHDNPFWYYLPTLLADFAPWSLALPFALVAAIRAPGARREPVRDLCLWLLVPLLVLSVASTKRGLYLLPIYPPAAMLVAWWLVDGAAPGESPGRSRRVALWVLFGLIVALSLALVWAWHLVRPAALAASLGTAIVLAVPGVLAWRAARAGDGWRLGLAVAAAAGLIELAAGAALVPAIVNRGASARPIGAALRRHLEIGDHVALYGIKEGSMGGLLYYAGQTLPVLHGPAELESHLAPPGAGGGSRSLVLMRSPVFEETARALSFPLVEAGRWRPAVVPWEAEGVNDFILAARGP
jgi:4-amino-4-deoxy-L-arabinose transferase-like glycosyltransferase